MSDAFQVIDQVARDVTFDELMRRNPEQLSAADRHQLIRLQRQRRAQAEAKAAARKAKREEQE